MGVYREGRADGGPREGADEVRWTNPGMVGAGGGGSGKVFSVRPIQVSWATT